MSANAQKFGIRILETRVAAQAAVVGAIAAGAFCTMVVDSFSQKSSLSPEEEKFRFLPY